VSITPASADTSPGSDPATAFGEQLRSLRQRRGWSQRQLGTEVFFSREYVALIERGLRPPNLAFVARAEEVLDAGGALSCLFAKLDVDRARHARQRASARRVKRPNGKVAVAAGQLRKVVAEEPVEQRSPAWWTALDALRRVLRDELNLVDAEAEIVDLERRCSDLAADAGQVTAWQDVGSAAALGVADAATCYNSRCAAITSHGWRTWPGSWRHSPHSPCSWGDMPSGPTSGTRWLTLFTAELDRHL
jgi:transcriptional regulator with XRE-family HTH domain